MNKLGLYILMGEEYLSPSDKQTADELRQTEISNLLHKICPVVIEKAEQKTNTSNKKDKSIIYWNMNYKGKFRRTLMDDTFCHYLMHFTATMLRKFLDYIRYNYGCNFNMAALVYL